MQLDGNDPEPIDDGQGKAAMPTGDKQASIHADALSEQRLDDTLNFRGSGSMSIPSKDAAALEPDLQSLPKHAVSHDEDTPSEVILNHKDMNVMC